jgi:putative ABC transport system permease protein
VQFPGPTRRMALVAAGVLIGNAGAALLSGALTKLLFGVQPLDPAVFAGVSVVLLAAGLAASYVPARRAMKVAPGVALGSE